MSDRFLGKVKARLTCWPFRDYGSNFAFVLKAFPFMNKRGKKVSSVYPLAFVVNVLNDSEEEFFIVRNGFPELLVRRLDCYSFVSFQIQLPHCGGFMSLMCQQLIALNFGQRRLISPIVAI